MAELNAHTPYSRERGETIEQKLDRIIALLEGLQEPKPLPQYYSPYVYPSYPVYPPQHFPIVTFEANTLPEQLP